MWDKIKLVWKIKEVRQKILYVLGLLVVFRVAATIPIPGVDLVALKTFFQNNQFLGLLNIFAGGGFETFSVVMLGVGPYITASVIFQLLGMIVPRVERLMQEGERGQQKINQWTRYLTVPVAVLQGYGPITLINLSARTIVPHQSMYEFIVALITISTGTLFLMWLGELITEKKVGNGISIMIFAGIVSSLPTKLFQAVGVFDSSQVTRWVLFAVIALVTIILVV